MTTPTINKLKNPRYTKDLDYDDYMIKLMHAAGTREE